ncbi:MAG: nucleotidyl transferase AbiEii/AbiGii toxin family protein [Proteobacteria bacterium]|nr:nucleotidyl transferase AbiEii/AbiGii toxin family protein [Pseudomonadota bacterium]
MNSTTMNDVLAFKASGSWKTLENLAQRMVADAQSRGGLPFEPKLGGGTRLMLALEHRISHDIDLFIRDPQWIGYLSPRLNDRFESELAGYDETAVSLKLRHAVGEIDFIVGMSLLGLPDEHAPETLLPLEPVAEVLAKKLFYRGWALTPRDLFDWWSIETTLPDAVPLEQLAELLAAKHTEIGNALASLKSSPVAQRTWDAMQAPNKPDLHAIVEWGQHALTRLIEIE